MPSLAALPRREPLTMPGKREPSPRAKHDASYKNFFTHPRTVADTLRAVAGDLSRHLDFTTLERMPASFVTEHLGQRQADMLWRIGTTRGGWVYILILLEFQSTINCIASVQYDPWPSVNSPVTSCSTLLYLHFQ